MVVKVVVCGLIGEKTEIDLCDTEEQFKSITVEQLKWKIQDIYWYPVDQQRLIFSGRVLEDGRLLTEYGVQHMSVIQLEERIRGGSFAPGEGDRGMGDKGGKNRSIERLSLF